MKMKGESEQYFLTEIIKITTWEKCVVKYKENSKLSQKCGRI